MAVRRDVSLRLLLLPRRPGPGLVLLVHLGSRHGDGLGGGQLLLLLLLGGPGHQLLLQGLDLFHHFLFFCFL